MFSTNVSNYLSVSSLYLFRLKYQNIPSKLTIIISRIFVHSLRSQLLKVMSVKSYSNTIPYLRTIILGIEYKIYK